MYFNENTEEYHVKTSENDVQYSNFNMGEMDKFKEFYSKEGDNCQYEGKIVAREHTYKLNVTKSTVKYMYSVFWIPPDLYLLKIGSITTLYESSHK